MDPREPASAPRPDGPPAQERDDGIAPRKDTSGLVGWILLIALAVGVLALRFFGGGGC